MKINIRWLGQSAFMLQRGEEIILIDPWLNENPLCPISLKDIHKLNVIVVTHGHTDHFGDTLKLMKNTEAKLISTPEIAWYMDKKGFIRGERSMPMGPGGSLKIGNFTFSMVKAVHPSALYAEEWTQNKEYFPDGGATGIVIKTEDGFSLYHAGDTALFMDMKLIYDRFKPDIVMLPIGGRFTMDWKDAVTACKWLSPLTIIPMHYNTNLELMIDEGEFVKAMNEQVPGTDVVILRPGKSFDWGTKPHEQEITN